MKKIMLIPIVLSVFAAALQAQVKPDYLNPQLPVERRVEDLISRMSIEEKVNQLQSQLTFLDEYKDRKWEVGHFRNIAHFVHNTPEGPVSPSECARIINEDTEKSINANRWGIPVLQNGEAIHTAMWGVTTCFPHSISMAASFDDALYYTVGEAVARETRAVGVRQVFAPVVNVVRDPRWGRTQESYGEDPFLNARMGIAWTKAMQDNGVIATPKHFVDNYGDGGHDSFASGTSWRVLREVFLEPFRACVQEGGAGSIMTSYNSVDGVPATANKVLLTDILRNEWGFKGFTVSDYSSMPGINWVHRTTNSQIEAQAQAFEAGMDVGLGFGDIASYSHLLDLVKSGRITEDAVDRSLRRILTAKFELGLFEEPYVDVKEADNIVKCKKHRELALESARRVMTLLKNENNALPLSEKDVKRIGVFGPASNVLSTGDYSGPSGGINGNFITDGVTPYMALKERMKGRGTVLLHTGSEDVSEMAKSCDVVIFFAAIQEGEGKDRSRLTLPERKISAPEIFKHADQIVDSVDQHSFEIDQEAMIDELSRSGVKTVVVLLNGSVVDMTKWIDKVDAVLEAWYPGEQGGTAIVETLFGDNNPGGRLPISWVRHAGQIPVYYYFKPSGRGYKYIDDDGKPLFPFGYGLSYTTFEYSDLIVPDRVNVNGDTKVYVTVKNTGMVDGDEVVQLYIRDVCASVVRPLKELKAFKRVSLKPGETKQVELVLPYRSFGLWNKDLEFVVEPGVFIVMIGKNAEEILLKDTIEVADM